MAVVQSSCTERAAVRATRIGETARTGGWKASWKPRRLLRGARLVPDVAHRYTTSHLAAPAVTRGSLNKVGPFCILDSCFLKAERRSETLAIF